MSRGPHEPPRLARALLDWLLPPGDAGAATGDLDEEYATFVRPQRGRLAADLWYWRQVILSAPRLLAGRGWSGSLGSLAGDVRFAARVLRRRPGYTLAAVVTLAVALGANTTVFSVVHAVLVRPLPFHEPERLVRPIPGQLFFLNSTGAGQLSERMTTFEAFMPWSRTLFVFDAQGGAQEVRGARVGWNHFQGLGVDPLLGRTFDRTDAERDDALVLSHGLWTRAFGADPGVIGRDVELYGRSFTVIGVLRPDHVPIEYDWEAWRVLPLDPALSEGSAIAGNARLRDGVDIEQAREELRRVLPAIWAEGGYHASEEEVAGLELVLLRDWLFGDTRPALLVLAGAVAFVLLLACANVANLIVVQTGSRARELAVRAAIGGARHRIARQLLVEVLLLGALGGLAALALAIPLLDVLTGLLPADLPRATQIGLSRPVIAFGLVSTLVVALVTGVVPALRAAGTQRAELTGGGAGGSRERRRLRSALVTFETALAVLLVVGAGLMLRTLAALGSVDPGFEADGVVTLRPSPPSDRYPGDAELEAYYARLQEELARLPGVRSVGAIQFLPMTSGGWWTSYVPEGLVLGADESAPNTAMRVVRPGYFETMRTPLVVGRLTLASDGLEGGPLPLVANETFAREAFPGEDALGRTVEVMGTAARIVGVVADIHQSDLRTSSHAELYVPFAVQTWRRMHLVVRVDDEAAALAPVAEAVRTVDPGVAMIGPRAMSEVVGSTLGSARLMALLLTAFGLVGLTLGAVGVYGVTAQSVAERRREIGIRIALGAEASAVARSTVLGGLAPVALGLTLGLGGALGGGRLLEGLLFEVGSADPGTLVAAPSVLVLVALLALVVPAGRASRVDPVRTLREE